MGAAEGGRDGARPAGFDNRREGLADEAGLYDDDPGGPYACAAYIDPDTGWLLYRPAELDDPPE
jgi:hypothetical protein